MSSGDYGPISYSQKKRMWEEHKYDTFNQISKDKSLMFNYFISNNDIFKMISSEDENKFKSVQLQIENKLSNFFFSSIAVIFVSDVALSYVAPRFNIFGRFKAIGIISKYLILPCIAYAVFKEYFMDEQQIFMYRMQEKYNFGFQDFMKANRVFQRALSVDRLQELYEKRDHFSWIGIPELPEENEKKNILL